MTKPRRAFLKQSAALVSGLTLSQCETAPEKSDRSKALPQETLKALAESVLPASALGQAGVERVVSDFQKWLDGFEPVAELDHGYLTSEIDYAPSHPGPRWSAQLEALELEAQKRYDRGFGKLSVEERQDIVRKQIRREAGERLPDLAEARHVAVALVAYFYGTSEANDLCYEAQIGRYTCRGLPESPRKPQPLKKEA